MKIIKILNIIPKNTKQFVLHFIKNEIVSAVYTLAHYHKII